ncbi:MAG TPA: thioredoxin domain-containing protein [Thermoanaerobaculia bacterium]|nr:thioredoxin domain-containing protein [Thermoanaerobaculia bacterium]
MNRGIVRSCPSCGKKNRVLYARLGEEARCGSCRAPLPPPTEPLAVDQGSELDGLLREAGLPVLVDFWAPWCGPCRTVAPEIGKVAERNAGRLLVVKVNTDVDPAVGAAHRISGIPTMALFRGGRELARTSGARPAAAIEGFVRQALQAA